jgi:hypothetical protein
MRLLALVLAIAGLIGFLIGFFRWDQRMPVNTTAGGLFCITLAAIIEIAPDA